MTKRFTDTEKLKDPWFRRLEPRLKIFFLFICDDCNHAGIWKENFDGFNNAYGYNLTPSDISPLNGKVFKIDEETFFIPGFIRYQYGPLNPLNKAHFGVIRALRGYGIDPDQFINPDLLPNGRGFQGSKE